ncbi:conserved hypothetical protein [Pectobacterium atrosepticum SCRI1043]|uniref:Uncharacterized protein n=1 Tax=Pectobacterium atrosepticum (strain SCRI 1043 / ATCC BAA-672) TaxID=218491 RepID=Q6D6Q2_PECAS|nr:conserved hypothetical protein [Pectobacterium atrosepticum SCRI1043]
MDQCTFSNENNLTFSTEGKYFHSAHCVIDTTLIGNEYFLIQCLLAHHLKIPSPAERGEKNNYGITVSLSGEIFQVFDKLKWVEEIKKPLSDIISNNYEQNSKYKPDKEYRKEYIPIYELPKDACFVIRKFELNKLVNRLPGEKNVLNFLYTYINSTFTTFLACMQKQSNNQPVN